MSEHTPLPWAQKTKAGKYLQSEYQVKKEHGSYSWFPIKSGKKVICLVIGEGFSDDEAAKNGDFIIKAVSERESLLEVCKSTLNALKSLGAYPILVRKLEETLTKAGVI